MLFPDCFLEFTEILFAIGYLAEPAAGASNFFRKGFIRKINISSGENSIIGRRRQTPFSENLLQINVT
jgi:hypothetical protein